MEQQGKTILIIDDDPLTCRLVEFLLSAQGHTVLIAGDHRSALAHLESRTPALVLLDTQLPGMNGLMLLRELKQQRPGLPVLMLTARAEPEDRLAGLEAGADDYITKPFEPAELLARVGAALRRSEEGR